ncbi:MAG: hypothetical protein ABWK01_04325 [Infirmifilum sp.]
MNSRFMVVAILSLSAIILYWFPVPLKVGDFVLGGYPWLAPESSRTAMVALGLLLSAVFLGLTGFMWYVSKRLEEMGEEEYTDVGEEAVVSGQW